MHCKTRKMQLRIWAFLFRVFCLEKISMNAIFETCSMCQNYTYVDAAIKSKMPDGLNQQTSCASTTVQNVFGTKKVH